MNNDFKKFALSQGVSGLKLHYANKELEASNTPYILEERQLNVTQMDIFSRLMKDRILVISGPVMDENMEVTKAQLLYLDMNSNQDISMYINTPGGSVHAGMSCVDVMQYIKSDVSTINFGMCASMGSVLLGAGTKGKRRSLPSSFVMIHQSSGGTSGNIQDAEEAMKHWRYLNDTLFMMLGEYCGKDPNVVKKDAERDYWMNSQQALEYGIIDEIILPLKKQK
jgi:ATP-dependent Clp protease protease subunit